MTSNWWSMPSCISSYKLKKKQHSIEIWKTIFWAIVYRKMCVSVEGQALIPDDAQQILYLQIHFMIVFHNDVVNVILNTWSFLLEKETNIWKPQLEHLYILLLFSLSLVFFPIPHKHLTRCLHKPNTFWPLLHSVGHRGFLVSVSLAELNWLTGRRKVGESPVQFGLLLTQD